MTTENVPASPHDATGTVPCGEADTQMSDTLPLEGESLERARALSVSRQKPPAQVPGYEILQCLGEGAYGSVWLAREHNTGKNVAIKFYTHRRGLDWSLLNREVEKLAVLYTARNIVGLLEVGWDSDPPYYVMEYLENGSLDAFLADGPLPVHEAVRIAQSMLQALVHAHGSGILHCDLKPANVLLDAEFEPRLCDFGQSRLSYEQNPALGTLFYMAPEQADLKAVPDARWDVYSLGALFYHLLCGVPPYRSPENEHLIQSAGTLEERLAIYRRIVRQSPRPAQHRRMRGVDKRLADIVDRCLRVDPERRFPNAQAVLDALEHRDRQRARRPLIALGIVGPILLAAALLPLARNAIQAAVHDARSKLAERALQGDVHTVSLLASNLEREIEERTNSLLNVAEDPRLRDVVPEAAEIAWEKRSELRALLDRHKTVIDERRRKAGHPVDTSWFLTDAEGVQIWRSPYSEQTMDRVWAHRDYFHGHGVQYDLEKLPEDIEPIQEQHLSEAFRSRSTHQYMVAISVPVWNAERTEVIGVLARTMHLGRLLAEHKHQIGVGENDANRSIALVDIRDGRLLDHRWMTAENVRSLPDAGFDQLMLEPQELARLQRLSRKVSEGRPAEGDDRSESYRDPAARLDPDRYAGEWLAAFWPVNSTGWTAVVQERKEAALRPVESIEAGLVNYAITGLLVSGLLIAGLWSFVFRALNSRSVFSWNRSAVRGGLSSSSSLERT